MWRGESCANGCLSGWKFIPGTQETGKQKTRKNEQLILFGLTQLQKPRENKKKVSTYGEGLRGSWTGDMGWNCLFFVVFFFHRFWCIFGSRWQKSRENKEGGKSRPMETVWGEAGQVTWGETVCFYWFVHGFGPVFASFRIWIVCMRVCDRSKLQEWKPISRQDDLKQTVQNMRVSTMCTPSPPMILPSVLYI